MLSAQSGFFRGVRGLEPEILHQKHAVCGDRTLGDELLPKLAGQLPDVKMLLTASPI